MLLVTFALDIQTAPVVTVAASNERQARHLFGILSVTKDMLYTYITADSGEIIAEWSKDKGYGPHKGLPMVPEPPSHIYA